MLAVEFSLRSLTQRMQVRVLCSKNTIKDPGGSMQVNASMFGSGGFGFGGLGEVKGNVQHNSVDGTKFEAAIQ